ncbi:MAG: hypothetical protein P8Z30_05260 [Acidobacteriota bacterium]
MKKLALLLIIPFALLLGVQTASAQRTKSPPASTSAERPNWNSYKPETIQGEITLIEVDKNLVVVEASGGVPYDITVTPKTRIEIDGLPATFDQLLGHTQRKATVTFVPRPTGDIAQSISVVG